MDIKFIIFTFLLTIIIQINCDDETTTTTSKTTTNPTTTTITPKPTTTTTKATATTTSPPKITTTKAASTTSTTTPCSTPTKKVNFAAETTVSTIDLVKNKTLTVPDNFLHTPLAKILNVIFNWADQHFPLIVKILQVAKTMTDTQLEQIPGAKIFLEILSEATHWHMVKEKLRPDQDFRNHSLENVIEEFSRHHNYSIKDIPFLKNITEAVTKIPAVKDLVKTTLTTNVNGVPFALTLVFLMQHIATQIPVGQFANITVQEQVFTNITREFRPMANIQLNRTISRMKNHTHQVIGNITNFSDIQVRKTGEIVANISDNVYNNIKNITWTLVNYGSGSMNRTRILQKLVQNMTKQQFEDLERFVRKSSEVPGKMFSNPLDGFSHMTNNALDIAWSSLSKVTDFTQWLSKLTWSNIEDIANVGLRTRDIGMNNIYQAQHLTVGVANHAYHSALNLTALTMNMSPLQMFRFKSVDDLIKNRQGQVEDNCTEDGFLTRIPVLGRLPGVSVMQAVFNKFPQISFMSFDQIMKIFDVFRSK